MSLGQKGEDRKMRKQVFIVMIVIAVMIAVGTAAGKFAAFYNKQILDFNYKFSKACIRWPDGTMKEVEVKKWNDYEQSDTVQIIGKDGKTYLTHYSNVVLVSE